MKTEWWTGDWPLRGFSREGAGGKLSAGAYPACMSDLLIIIPAYNEQGRVGRVIEDVRGALPGADVLVVDDGSSDGTAEEARQAGAAVLSLPVNSGYGVALQTGYKFGVRGGYATIGQIDADGQHRAEYLTAMLEALGGARRGFDRRLALSGI